jgi:hypothetical protein
LVLFYKTCLNYIQFFVLIVDVLESNVGAQFYLFVGQSSIDFVAKVVPRFWNDLSIVYGWICPWVLKQMSILWLDLWLDLWCFKGLSSKFCCHLSCAILKSYACWDEVMVILMKCLYGIYKRIDPSNLSMSNMPKGPILNKHVAFVNEHVIVLEVKLSHR